MAETGPGDSAVQTKELFGQQVTGIFPNGGTEPHGECVVKLQDQTIAKIQFDHGLVVKKLQVDQADGVRITFFDGNEQAGYRGRVDTLDYIYEGELDQDGRIDGNGTIHYAFGAVRFGQFHANQPAGIVTTEYVPGQFTTEDFSTRPPTIISCEGRGSFVSKAGSKLFGLIYLDNGKTQYKGYLDAQGLPSGFGSEIRAGMVRSGHWDHGKFVREEAKQDPIIDSIQPRFEIEIKQTQLPQGLEERVLGGARIRGKFISGQLHGLALIEQNGGVKNIIQFDYGVVRRRISCQTATAHWEFEHGSDREGKYTGTYESHSEDYKYLGEFDLEGKQHGRGRRLYSSGEIIEAEFCRGVVTGRVYRQNQKGDYWVSQYQNGEKQRDIQVKIGTSYWFFAEGDVERGYTGQLIVSGKYSYEGGFRPDGTQHGPGKRCSAQGEIVEGNFKDGFVDGNIKHTYATGQVVEEQYDMGRLVKILT